MAAQPALPLAELARWVNRSRVDLDGITGAGARLLDQRLASRRRIDRITISIGFGGAAAFVVAGFATVDVPRFGLDATPWWMAAAIVLFSSMIWLRSVLVRRSEQRIVANLSRRVAAEQAVPTWRRIGSLRAANAAVLLAAPSLPLIALLESSVATSVLMLYLVLFATMLVAAVVTAYRDLTCPALAVDETSLGVDDRWRSQAIYWALYPLVVLAGGGLGFLASSNDDTSPGWIHGFVPFVGAGLLIVISCLEHLAQFVDHRRLGRPMPWERWLVRR